MNLTQIAILIFGSACGGLLVGRYLLPSGRHVMFGHGYTEQHRWLGDCGMKPGVALDAAWQDGITDLVRGRRDAMRLAARVRAHDERKAAGRGDTRPVSVPAESAVPAAALVVSVSPPVVPGPAERDAVSGASGSLLGRPPAGPGTPDHRLPGAAERAVMLAELAGAADVPRPGERDERHIHPSTTSAPGIAPRSGPGHAPPDELAEELADEAETFLRALRESPEEWHLRLEDEHREWCVRNGLEWQPLDFAPSPVAAFELEPA